MAVSIPANPPPTMTTSVVLDDGLAGEAGLDPRVVVERLVLASSSCEYWAWPSARSRFSRSAR